MIVKNKGHKGNRWQKSILEKKAQHQEVGHGSYVSSLGMDLMLHLLYCFLTRLLCSQRCKFVAPYSIWTICLAWWEQISQRYLLVLQQKLSSHGCTFAAWRLLTLSDATLQALGK